MEGGLVQCCMCVWLWKGGGGGQEPEMVVVVLGEQRLARAWAKVMLRPVPVQNKDVMIVLNLRTSDVAEKERGTNLPVQIVIMYGNLARGANEAGTPSNDEGAKLPIER